MVVGSGHGGQPQERSADSADTGRSLLPRSWIRQSYATAPTQTTRISYAILVSWKMPEVIFAND